MRFALAAGLMSGLAAPLVAQTAPPQSGELNRADFIAQMDAEFSRFDGDRNGVIKPEEIVASQRRAAQNEALRQNAQVFASLDKNGDRMLDSQEFAALANPDAIPVDPNPLMQQFDSDKDEVVTLVEYRIATQANFDRIDTDRNGVVSPIEMRAAGIVR